MILSKRKADLTAIRGERKRINRIIVKYWDDKISFELKNTDTLKTDEVYSESLFEATMFFINRGKYIYKAEYYRKEN